MAEWIGILLVAMVGLLIGATVGWTMYATPWAVNLVIKLPGEVSFAQVWLLSALIAAPLAVTAVRLPHGGFARAGLGAFAVGLIAISSALYYALNLA